VAVVYILRDGSSDQYKFGSAGDFEERLAHHKTSNFDLQPVWIIEVESRSVASACETHLKGSYESKRILGTKEFFELSSSDLDDVGAEAYRFLHEDHHQQREVDRLAKEPCDGTIVKPGDAEYEAWRLLLYDREVHHRSKVNLVRSENVLKLTIGHAAELEGLATWKSHTKTQFNQAALKVAEPEIWKTYAEESIVRKFLPR
jgi:predicted GIY-YIG superfamily endonuclease